MVVWWSSCSRHAVVLALLLIASWTDPTPSRTTLAACDRVCKGPLVPCEPRPRTLTPRHQLGRRPILRHLRGLTPRQRRFCRKHSDLIPALVRGARAATRHCRARFRHTRWNCHALGQHLDFGHVQVKGTPEAAVMYALQAGGITLEVYTSCRRGHLSSCTCRPRDGDTRAISFWKWSGCRGGLRYSARHTRRFLNAREREGDALSLMNRHNNRAGTKAVTRGLRRRCHCHGPSGSCSVKTCWQDAPGSVAAVGARLQLELTRAQLVQLTAGQLRRVRGGRKPPAHRLVHLERSPSYCDRDPETGHNGTVGRQCQRDRSRPGSCSYLCCGRGYNTLVTRRRFCCNYHTHPGRPTVCLKSTHVRTCQ